MHHGIRLFSTFVLVLLFTGVFAAETVPMPPAKPATVSIVPAPPSVAAKAFLLTDYDSGAILASKNPDMRVEPASLTKLMTSYIYLQWV